MEAIMTKKKSGLAGLRETLKIDKLMDKLSEVVDGKSTVSDIDSDDVIANRIKQIHELVDQTRRVHEEQAKSFAELGFLLKQLLVDIVNSNEQSSDAAATVDETTSGNPAANKESVEKEADQSTESADDSDKKSD